MKLTSDKDIVPCMGCTVESEASELWTPQKPRHPYLKTPGAIRLLVLRMLSNRILGPPGLFVEVLDVQGYPCEAKSTDTSQGEAVVCRAASDLPGRASAKAKASLAPS